MWAISTIGAGLDAELHCSLVSEQECGLRNWWGKSEKSTVKDEKKRAEIAGFYAGGLTIFEFLLRQRGNTDSFHSHKSAAVLAREPRVMNQSDT